MAWCATHGQHDATTVGCPRCASGYPFPFPDPRDTELASLRARIDAAIAECERIEDERGHTGDETLGSRHAARAIRAKLEGT